MKNLLLVSSLLCASITCAYAACPGGEQAPIGRVCSRMCDQNPSLKAKINQGRSSCHADCMDYATAHQCKTGWTRSMKALMQHTCTQIQKTGAAGVAKRVCTQDKSQQWVDPRPTSGKWTQCEVKQGIITATSSQSQCKICKKGSGLCDQKL